MEIKVLNPPRKFSVGLENQITIKDCGQVILSEDELVTIKQNTNNGYDVVSKSWGFYATPSLNGRLKELGFKAALVENSQGKIFIMLVDKNKLGDFNNYLLIEKHHVVKWLDE